MKVRGIVCVVVSVLVAGGLAIQAEAQDCGCMDVVLVIDDTGSMMGAIDNVKAGLADIVATALSASGGDLKMGLVSFSDIVEANQPLTFIISDVETEINLLSAGGGGGEPEASDAALDYVVSGSTACGLIESEGPLGFFRDGCVKIAVLVTDARPGGCDDAYVAGVDDVNAAAVADAAAAEGILISAVYTPTYPTFYSQITPIMQYYADATGGVYIEVASDGTGTGEAIEDIIQSCGTAGIDFAWDLKFCSLPNAFNCNRKTGVVPLTIFGSEILDVAFIDVASLRLAIAGDPSVQTAGGPVAGGGSHDRGGPGDVDTQGCVDDYGNPDGFPDLNVAFDAGEVGQLIGCPLEPKTLSADLVVIGTLLDGTPLSAVVTQSLWNVGKIK